MSLSYFSKPKAEKNPIFKYCQNRNWKKTRKLKLDQIHFWTMEKFALKKMHFGQILVKIFSQIRKLKNLTSFEPIFLNQKNSILKDFILLKPEKFKPEPKRGN